MSTASLPELAVRGDLRDALTGNTLRALDGGALAEWLAGRRWFGAKGEGIRAARITGAVPVPWGTQGAAIALVEVEVGAGTRHYYQLPLTVVAGEAPSQEVPPLARVAAGAARGLLVDATLDARFRRDVGAAFERGGERHEGDGLAFVVEGVPGVAMPRLGEGRLGSAEQSNTSMMFGSAAILKFYRRLEAGENPDVEITRFLTTQAHFDGTPALLGEARLERGGERMTAVMLQRLVADARDGWSFALDRGRAYFADHGAVAPPNTFIAEARTLGRVTGRMHGALATGTDDAAFGTAPVRAGDLDDWVRAAQASVQQGMRLLQEALAGGRVRPELEEDVRRVLGGGDAYEAYVKRSADLVRRHAGERIRHHGDYHLGQVLRDGAGNFWVIDFEGEPARPLEARREHHSPLRDVAGMLRSFVYAAATLERDHPGDADAGTIARHRIRAELWERAARDAYLEAYLQAAPARILPDSPERVAALVALFETEKVFYELAYEVNNRPGWVWIPLRGILRLPAR